MNEDLNIMVAGAAGQGMQTIGIILGKIFVRGGCEVFASQDNMSRIRGGHNFFQVRVSDRPVGTSSQPVHILIALNGESVRLHREEVVSDGVILFDSEKSEVPGEDGKYLGIPLERLAEEKGGDTLFSNSVAIGATLAILGWDFGALENYLGEFFSAKAEMVEGNIKAARAGYEDALTRSAGYGGPSPLPRESGAKMFLTGHEAVALGALTAGCQFMSAYPMSPSTSIMVYLAGNADEFDLAVEQAEDEIAAINMAIGASYAGVRSMTATSGGGFSLMVEAFGLAGISETPLVIIEAQRPGPATGLPTRTAQADLLFVLHASQDEFPRVIFSPGTAQEAFYQTIKAFEIADKYQVPVVVLTDQFLADSYFTEERFDISRIEINRHLLSEREANALEKYNRYQITETGISPRAVPGAFGLQVVADGHEHDEEGHITEDASTRKAMMEKRFRKMIGIAGEISPPKLMGNPDADLLLVGWGSTYGAMAEAIEILNGDGIELKGMYFNELWPFPTEEASRVFHEVDRWAVVENNYTAQLARLIRMELQEEPDGHILKYTGRPFSPLEIVDAFRKEMMG